MGQTKRGVGVGAGQGEMCQSLSLSLSPADKDTLCLWDGRGGRGCLRTAGELELFVSAEGWRL